MCLKERILSFERVVTIAGKGRYAGSWHFFLVSTMFSKAFSVIVIKLRALSGKALTSNSMGEQQCQLRFTVLYSFFFKQKITRKDTYCTASASSYSTTHNNTN